MNAVALMYHDVVPAGREHDSGFPGGDAAIYKVTPEAFEQHLRAIATRTKMPPVTVDALSGAGPAPLLLTFDDGGASAPASADRLEAHGWRGHFFVTTDYIDRPGFLTRSALRDLRARGHVVGSHSCSHPLRMARLSSARLREEWTRSVTRLEDLLGQRITVASVPGGHDSPAVADTARGAGIRVLFTSRPVTRAERRDGLLVLGRFAIQRSMSAEHVAALAANASSARIRRRAAWEARRIAKTIAGEKFLKLRGWWLGASDAVAWGDEKSKSEV